MGVVLQSSPCHAVNGTPRQFIEAVLALLALAAVTILVIYPVQDFDIFWHVANGRAMVEQHRIINEEIFSYTAAGKHFSNHAWLAQIFFYLCYTAAGANGLIAAKTMLTLAICGVIFLFARRRGLGTAPAAALFLAAITASLFRYVVRPHLFSHLLLATCAALLFSWRADPKNRPLLFVLPPIMLLWDILHGAIYGVVFMAAFFAGETTGALRDKITRGRVPPRYKTLAAMLGLTLAAMLASPYGPRSYDIFLQFVNGTNAMTSMTAEFQPTVISDHPVFITLTALAYLAVLARGRQADATSLLTLIPFTILALRYVRGVGPAAVIAAMSLAENLPPLMARPGAKLLRRAVLPGAAAVILAGALYTGYHKFLPPPKYDSFGTGLSADAFPVGSTRFIKAAGLTGNLYNTDRYGGYLSFFLYPERKIFHYNHHMLFNALENFVHHPESRARWNINYALIGRADEWDMFARDGYVPVYWEPTAAVMVRDTPENTAIIQRWRIRYFSPLMTDADFAAQAARPFVRPTLLRETADYLRFRRDPRMAVNLSRALLANGQPPPQGLALAESALAGNSGDPALLEAAGSLAYRNGDLDTAETRLRRVLRRHPGRTAARFTLAYVLYDKRRFQEAARLFTALLAQAPRHPDTLYGLALCRYRLKEYDEAARLWRRYLEIAPQGPWADRARELLDNLPVD